MRLREKWESCQRKRGLARAFADPTRDIVHLQFETKTIGMFAQLSSCVRAADIAQQFAKRPVMRLVSENYLEPGEQADWFSTYFVNKAEADLPPDLAPTIMSNGGELPLEPTYDSRAQVKSLFTRHFGIRPEIEAQVDAFAREHRLGAHTLSLHYRGTDKHREAPQQAVADVIERVSRYIDTLQGVENIFVASDEASFIEASSDGIAGLPVVSMDDSIRSDEGTPVHLQGLKEGNRAMGFDAVRNALMLSRGGWLCRTSSFLSAWSAVFNPAIKVAVFNTPYEDATWRLERVVLKDAQRI